MVAKRYIVYAGLALVAVTGVIGVLVFSQLHQKTPQQIKGDQRVPGIGIPKQKKSIAHLYFADKDNIFLISEERTLSHTEDPTNFSRKIIEALINGPSEGLTRTIPVDTSLRALYITEAGICYVDLSAEVKEQHPGGVQSELLTLYSIVNSLVLNIPDIQAVKILIDGQETMTLAGHIDLQEPVNANMLLIR
jgi:spore germination protein GerM